MCDVLFFFSLLLSLSLSLTQDDVHSLTLEMDTDNVKVTYLTKVELMDVIYIYIYNPPFSLMNIIVQVLTYQQKRIILVSIYVHITSMTSQVDII